MLREQFARFGAIFFCMYVVSEGIVLKRRPFNCVELKGLLNIRMNTLFLQQSK